MSLAVKTEEEPQAQVWCRETLGKAGDSPPRHLQTERAPLASRLRPAETDPGLRGSTRGGEASVPS